MNMLRVVSTHGHARRIRHLKGQLARTVDPKIRRAIEADLEDIADDIATQLPSWAEADQGASIDENAYVNYLNRGSE